MVRPPLWALLPGGREARWWGPDLVSQSGRRWMGKGWPWWEPLLTSPLPTVGSSSSLSSAGSSSARHLAPGAYSEATLEVPAPHCCSFADPVTANLEGAVTFEAPDLPEETLMEVRAGAGVRPA